jgi:putative ABC transport system permease protein
MDSEQPVYAIRTLEDAFAATTLQHRTATILLVVFAGLAVALAALGVYAVMAQSVAKTPGDRRPHGTWAPVRRT